MNIDAYVKHLENDYFNSYPESAVPSAVAIMPKRDRYYVELVHGKKYIKVVAVSWGQRSAHSFIVKNEDPKSKFRQGDILKAASWAAPATNFKRGTLSTGNFMNCGWSGCN